MNRSFKNLSIGGSANKQATNGRLQASVIGSKGISSLAPNRPSTSSGTNSTAVLLKGIVKTKEVPVIRVGKDFQAEIPLMTPKEQQDRQAAVDRALMIWCPPNEDQLSEEKVEKINMYMEEAKKQHNYSGEQALGILFWHKYDISKATQDLGNFAPHPDEWTVEDKAKFEEAFQDVGKDFQKIMAFLTEKSMPSLIRHYYRWKKIKKTSVMDKETKKSPGKTD